MDGMLSVTSGESAITETDEALSGRAARDKQNKETMK